MSQNCSKACGKERSLNVHTIVQSRIDNEVPSCACLAFRVAAHAKIACSDSVVCAHGWPHTKPLAKYWDLECIATWIVNPTSSSSVPCIGVRVQSHLWIYMRKLVERYPARRCYAHHYACVSRFIANTGLFLAPCIEKLANRNSVGFVGVILTVPHSRHQTLKLCVY